MLRVNGLKLLNGKEISFQIKKGEALLLEGANGSGKSLLLKSLARLIPSSWSELSFEAQDISSFPVELWRSKVLYLPPDVIFDPEFSVEDFLEEPFGFSIHKGFKKVFDPRKYLDLAQEKMQVLSSGQKQSVALLRAISLNPDVLLLDEPFAHMDSQKRELFFDLLTRWCKDGKILIIVSHIEVELAGINIQKIVL
jgi:ABC-type multidrug transport system ATPase subunit